MRSGVFGLVMAPAALACAVLAPAAAGQTVDVIAVFRGPAERDDFLNTPAVVNAHDFFGVIPGVALRVGPEELAELRADPGLKYVVRDDELWAFGGDAVPYGVDLVKARGVWPATRGAGVRVAVLDTGIDANSPDAPTPVLSQSFVAGQSVQDGNGHGTHVAGTIAARDNGLGVIGVAPEVDLLVGKVLADSGSGNSSDAIAGIQWAVQNGARVINMSLGGPAFNQAYQDACDAANAAGVLVVAAAGNNLAAGTLAYPAAFPSVLSVGAVDRNRAWASYSVQNSQVDVAAPGTSVWSTVRVRTGDSPASVVYRAAPRESRPFAGSAQGQVTAEVVDCGQACSAAEVPGTVAGRIALIRRGGCPGDANLFVNKVALARNAGAVGFIIANNTTTPTDGFAGTLGTTVSDVVVSLSQGDGDALRARVLSGERVVATISTGTTDYALSSGTSMASPHAAGVAALVFARLGPAATPAQVRDALIRGAIRPPAFTPPATPTRDDQIGFGIIHAPAAFAAAGVAVDCDGNGVADYLDILNGTLADSDGDGVPDVCPGAGFCATDYNGDRVLNLDDLADFLTDFYTFPPIPGGTQPAAWSLSTALVGLGVACPEAADAAPPYAADAYRRNGYRVGFALEGSLACPPTGPNLDNLADYITAFYSGGCP